MLFEIRSISLCRSQVFAPQRGILFASTVHLLFLTSANWLLNGVSGNDFQMNVNPFQYVQSSFYDFRTHQLFMKSTANK